MSLALGEESMHQLHDAEIAKRLLDHLARAFGCPDAVYLAGPDRILGRTIDQWVDMQIRLHQLPAEPLLRAVTAAGIDAGAIIFEGQLARLRTLVERSALTGLKPGLAWLDDRRPPQPQKASICHGDFHPLNILADENQPTGVIDWANAVIAEPAMDVGSAIANISAVPRSLPWGLRAAAHTLIGAALRRYERTYRGRRPLDDQAVRYYEVFRAVAQLVWVGHARAAGRAGGGAFHSAAGVGNLIALISKLSGISLRLE
jgi:aminoglycoside phosphotransferase (APT) family kinase protein